MRSRVRYRRGGDLPLDTFDEAIGREAVRHRDGVADGQRARSAVPDDGDARHAEQWRAAVFRVVQTTAEAPERAPREQRSDAPRKRARQLLSQKRFNRIHEALADF